MGKKETILVTMQIDSNVLLFMSQKVQGTQFQLGEHG